MLFCYSPAANADNWLHETVTQMIRVAFHRLNEGNAVDHWPNCIPEAYRQRLEGRPKLRELFEVLSLAAAQLTNLQRNEALATMECQNDIPAVFQSQDPCNTIDALPNALRAPVRDLFEYAFSILIELGIRDNHYALVYNSLPARVCPFCGLEHFDAPGAPRHDLDHYLLITKYPFAGCNLKNLAPMGDRCNSSYKRAQDILVANDGQKRRCFDPYGNAITVVTLVHSEPFGVPDPRVPHWQVDLDGQPESVTWDAVWKIRERYVRDVLNAEYRHWLAEFGRWWRRHGDPNDRASLVPVLGVFIQSLEMQGFSERAFLKRAVFEMLRNRLTIPGQAADRISEFLQNVARPDAVFAA